MNRQVEATMRSVLELFHRCVDLDRSLPEEAYLYTLNIEEPGWLADMIASSIISKHQRPFEVVGYLRSN